MENTRQTLKTFAQIGKEYQFAILAKNVTVRIGADFETLAAGTRMRIHDTFDYAGVKRVVASVDNPEQHMWTWELYPDDLAAAN